LLFIFLLVNLYLEYFILFIGKSFREGSHIVPIILMANLVMGIFFNLSISSFIFLVEVSRKVVDR